MQDVCLKKKTNYDSTNSPILLCIGKHSAQWALDDVLIGMNDSSQTGFQDKFDGTVDLQASWYRIQGGQVDIDCLSMDTALMFSENIGMCHQILINLYVLIL